jgi:hypothetical protein
MFPPTDSAKNTVGRRNRNLKIPIYKRFTDIE